MTTNSTNVDGDAFKLRLMASSDEPLLLAFAKSLPVHDLLFLPRDISEPKVLSAWIKEGERGTLTTLLALRDGKVVGCGTLVQDPHSWSPHVAEIRVVVAPNARSLGVGRALTQQMFTLALSKKIERLTAQMTVDQVGAISIFEGLGFRGQALFPKHVRDRDGRFHDIVVLGHDVAGVSAQMQAYGMREEVAAE